MGLALSVTVGAVLVLKWASRARKWNRLNGQEIGVSLVVEGGGGVTK